jgi:hypothetical protein
MLVCVFIVFSFRRESPDLILIDEPLISEVVLSAVGNQSKIGVTH